MRNILFACVLTASTLFTSCVEAQTAPFEVSLEAIQIEDLGGLQSYAWGQHDGKWLIVGGRLDGLHRRQPWAAFDVAGHNTQLFVIDPAAGQKWSTPLSSLSVPLQEQLSSTNMQFIQEDDYLYCAGGYGYSATEGDHTTFDKLTAIDVPNVIESIITGEGISSHFRQITDPQFQVTGGHLEKIYDTYYLLGGQNFIGRYNPMGPDHGPGFFQEYTDAIRKFKLSDDGTTISITHLPAHQDAVNLHRRDYNAVAQILPNGQEGITMFSGVFQQDVDLPFLNSVNVDSSSYAVNEGFNQYYNHYHCPVVKLYSNSSNEMHNVFFGGIAQFYDEAGTLVQDDDVPFVKTIARVSRDAEGTMTETKLPVEMPALLGAGAEFIPNEGLAQFENGVLDMDELPTEAMHIGYIYGGISSSAPNIFFINDGTQSEANSQLFKVYVNRNTTSNTKTPQNKASLGLNLFPNPAQAVMSIAFVLAKAETVTLKITDASGTLLAKEILEGLVQGANTYRTDISSLTASGTYLVTLETASGKETKRLILKR